MFRRVVIVQALVLLAAVSLLPGIVPDAAAQTGSIVGHVNDLAGSPIEGAEITGENSEWRIRIEGTTNDSGQFSFVGLRAGGWVMSIRRRGFQPLRGLVMVNRIGTARINIGMVADARYPPPPPTGALANMRATDLEAALDAADTQFEDGDYDSAIDAYERILELAPRLTGVHVQIGHAWLAKRNVARALASFRAVPAEDPLSVEAQTAIDALQSDNRNR